MTAKIIKQTQIYTIFPHCLIDCLIISLTSPIRIINIRKIRDSSHPKVWVNCVLQIKMVCKLSSGGFTPPQHPLTPCTLPCLCIFHAKRKTTVDCVQCRVCDVGQRCKQPVPVVTVCLIFPLSIYVALSFLGT